MNIILSPRLPPRYPSSTKPLLVSNRTVTPTGQRPPSSHTPSGLPPLDSHLKNGTTSNYPIGGPSTFPPSASHGNGLKGISNGRRSNNEISSSVLASI
jgi:hypothetical protein